MLQPSNLSYRRELIKKTDGDGSVLVWRSPKSRLSVSAPWLVFALGSSTGQPTNPKRWRLEMGKVLIGIVAALLTGGATYATVVAHYDSGNLGLLGLFGLAGLAGLVRPNRERDYVARPRADQPR